MRNIDEAKIDQKNMVMSTIRTVLEAEMTPIVLVKPVSETLL